MTSSDGSGFHLSDHAWRRSIAPQHSSDPTVEEPANEPASTQLRPSAGSSLMVTTTASLLMSVTAAAGAYQQEWEVTIIAWAVVAALAVFVRRAGIGRQRRPDGLRGVGLTSMLVICYAAWAYVAVAGWIATFRWLPTLFGMIWN